MYASLQRIDLVADEPGGRVAVQTDHRQTHEISAELGVSIAFAAARIANAARGDISRVRMVHFAEPPAAYLAFVSASGAAIEVAPDPTPRPPQPDADAAEAQFHDAMARLGAAVFARHRLAVDVSGLAQLQAIYAQRVSLNLDDEVDQIDHWVCVVELGAAVGALMAAQFGARWVRQPDDYSLIPYLCAAGPQMMSVFSKCERFFRDGEDEQPLQLIGMLQEAAEAPVPDGPVMPLLRAGDWELRASHVAQPLLEYADKLEPHRLPLVSMVKDMPQSVANIEVPPDDELATMQAEALANLAATTVSVAEVDIGFPLLVGHDSYYAAEKLLDASFMRGLQQRLGAEMLLAAVPCRGRLMVCAAPLDLEDHARFSAIVEQEHDNAAQRARLSTELLIVSDGAVVGLVRQQRAAEA